MHPHELACWLGFWRIPSIGPSHFRFVCEHVGAIGLLFEQTARQLEQLGFTSPQCELILHWRSSDSVLRAGVERDLAWLAQSPQHHILTWEDSRYPSLLQQISGAPPLLFVRGDADCLGLPQIAIVGSRQSTRAGKQLAQDFAASISRHGFITTSGLALGIDSAAHEGALDGGNKTIAVLAHGLDAVYPPRNRPLAERVMAQGALVTEFPVGVTPRPEFFPRRNRIISGLSLGVLVVEAALKSGSLITAHEAIDQGREVFAIPGSIHNPLAKGCHALIRNGAKLVETADQVVEELRPLLGFMRQGALFDEDASQTGGDGHSNAYPAGSTESRLLDALEYDPCSIDLLVQLTGISVADVSSALILLELEGQVQQVQGGYCRA